MESRHQARLQVTLRVKKMIFSVRSVQPTRYYRCTILKNRKRLGIKDGFAETLTSLYLEGGVEKNQLGRTHRKNNYTVAVGINRPRSTKLPLNKNRTELPGGSIPLNETTAHGFHQHYALVRQQYCARYSLDALLD